MDRDEWVPLPSVEQLCSLHWSSPSPRLQPPASSSQLNRRKKREEKKQKKKRYFFSLLTCIHLYRNRREDIGGGRWGGSEEGQQHPEPKEQRDERDGEDGKRKRCEVFARGPSYSKGGRTNSRVNRDRLKGIACKPRQKEDALVLVDAEGYYQVLLGNEVIKTDQNTCSQTEVKRVSLAVCHTVSHACVGGPVHPKSSLRKAAAAAAAAAADKWLCSQVRAPSACRLQFYFFITLLVLTCHLPHSDRRFRKEKLPRVWERYPFQLPYSGVLYLTVNYCWVIQLLLACENRTCKNCGILMLRLGPRHSPSHPIPSLRTGTAP